MGAEADQVVRREIGHARLAHAPHVVGIDAVVEDPHHLVEIGRLGGEGPADLFQEVVADAADRELHQLGIGGRLVAQLSDPGDELGMGAEEHVARSGAAAAGDVVEALEHEAAGILPQLVAVVATNQPALRQGRLDRGAIPEAAEAQAQVDPVAPEADAPASFVGDLADGRRLGTGGGRGRLGRFEPRARCTRRGGRFGRICRKGRRGRHLRADPRRRGEGLRCRDRLGRALGTDAGGLRRGGGGRRGLGLRRLDRFGWSRGRAGDEDRQRECCRRQHPDEGGAESAAGAGLFPAHEPADALDEGASARRDRLARQAHRLHVGESRGVADAVAVGENGRVVAAELALDADPVGDPPHGGMEEEGGLDRDLEQVHPMVPPPKVGQLVDQESFDLVLREAGEGADGEQHDGTDPAHDHRYVDARALQDPHGGGGCRAAKPGAGPSPEWPVRPRKPFV